MRSVFYIGPYRQNDEWGYTSKAFATLLAGQNVDLVLRPIWFNNETQSANIEHLERYEFKKVTSKDILIQHGLPTYLNYNGDFKTNIAVTSVDCRVDNTDWVTHLNLFDKIIVFSQHEKTLLIDSGVTTEVFAFDFAPVFVDNTKQELNLNFNGVKFFTTGSLDIKSGLREVIIAYMSRFSILDNTILIVATKNSKELEEEINKIKGSLGKFSDDNYYPHIGIINSSEASVLNALHEYCDFFIEASYNARTSQNILKSILYSNIPIVLDTCEFIKDYKFKIKSFDEICLYPQRPLKRLYSGEYTWKIPSMQSIKENLDEAYKQYLDKDLEREKQKIFKMKTELFSLPNKWIMECIQ